VGHAVPVEHLLLLLCTDAVVLVKEIEKTTLWFFERCIGARLQIAQIRKDTLLELLRVLDWPAERLKSERKTSDNIRTRNVKEVVPVPFVNYSFPNTSTSTYHRTQETYSPVGKRNRRMYWSGVQSTGADIKKYLTSSEGQ